MNGGSVYVTVDGHFKPVHVSMKGTGEEGFLEFMLEDVEKAKKLAGKLLKEYFPKTRQKADVKEEAAVRKSKDIKM